MIEFSFEIISNTNINMEYIYGSETFIFNLFFKNGEWTLHPFDGILLQNRDLCKLVIIDLFKNKYFQIMLAKENIPIMNLRTSIELEPARNDEVINASERRGRRLKDEDIEEFIGNNSIQDILKIESDAIEKKIIFYSDLLKKMFMDNYGSGDGEFDKVQSLVRVYKETQEKIHVLGR
jgi:hypothetical protein